MRIQLELPKDDVKELQALMGAADIRTYKELFSNALTLLYWVVQEVHSGRIIASVDEEEGKYKELAMPMLRALAKAGAASQGEAAVSTRART